MRIRRPRSFPRPRRSDDRASFEVRVLAWLDSAALRFLNETGGPAHRSSDSLVAQLIEHAEAQDIRLRLDSEQSRLSPKVVAVHDLDGLAERAVAFALREWKSVKERHHEASARGGRNSKTPVKFTVDQLEALLLEHDGLSARQLAEKMNCSVRTVWKLKAELRARIERATRPILIDPVSRRVKLHDDTSMPQAEEPRRQRPRRYEPQTPEQIAAERARLDAEWTALQPHLVALVEDDAVPVPAPRRTRMVTMLDIIRAPHRPSCQRSSALVDYLMERDARAILVEAAEVPPGPPTPPDRTLVEAYLAARLEVR